jgi:hypothetical protein
LYIFRLILSPAGSETELTREPEQLIEASNKKMDCTDKDPSQRLHCVQDLNKSDCQVDQLSASVKELVPPPEQGQEANQRLSHGVTELRQRLNYGSELSQSLDRASELSRRLVLGSELSQRLAHEQTQSLDQGTEQLQQQEQQQQLQQHQGQAPETRCARLSNRRATDFSQVSSLNARPNQIGSM